MPVLSRDDLREAPLVVEAVLADEDVVEVLVVLVEEAVAVAERFELPLPDRKLQLAELRARCVRLGDHADERVDVVHVPVDRLQPAANGERRSAATASLGVAERDDVAAAVAQLREVQAARVVVRCPSSPPGRRRSSRP